LSRVEYPVIGRVRRPPCQTPRAKPRELKHATFVEKVWFHSRGAGVPRADLGLPDTVDESFVLEPEDTVASVRAGFLAACEHSRVVAAAHDLDEQLKAGAAQSVTTR
jgi:hypothetical protein